MDHIFINVMSGAQDGKVFSFHKTTIMLGRHRSDDVYLQYDTTVSRHHARITKKNDTYFLEDVGPEEKGSANGTYLIDMDNGINESKITDKTKLSSGTHFRLGTIWLKFEYSSDSQYYTEIILNEIDEAQRKLSHEEMEDLFIKIESILKKLEKIVAVQDLFKIMNEIIDTINDAQKKPPSKHIEEESVDENDLGSIEIFIQKSMKKKFNELKGEINDDK